MCVVTLLTLKTKRNAMKEKRRIIYIIGPYSADTEEAIEKNIIAAEQCAMTLANLGVGFFCPHLNTRGMHRTTVAPYDFWIEVGMTILEKCGDGAVVLPGWEESKGSLQEIMKMERLGRPIFYLKHLKDVDTFDLIQRFALKGVFAS